MCPFSYLVVLMLAMATVSPLPSTAHVAGPPPMTTTLTAIEQFLPAHNTAHAEAGVPPPVWNTTLQLDARRYVSELRTRCRTVPLHAWGTEGVYDRNLFKGVGFGSAAEAVASWVGERRWYDADADECSVPEGKTCAHYRQVVWRDTAQVRCLRRIRSFGEDTVAVCTYYQPAPRNANSRH